MANSADPPSPTPSPAAAAGEEHPDAAAHLVCAYSPRWLSGPTPGFEGLVATFTPHGATESERAAGH